MALCRKCRVREASEIWHDGLCPHCYFEYNEKRKKEEQPIVFFIILHPEKLNILITSTL